MTDAYLAMSPVMFEGSGRSVFPQVESGRKLMICFRQGKNVLLRHHSHSLTRRKVKTTAERLKPQDES